jgi:hypothetical protein
MAISRRIWTPDGWVKGLGETFSPSPVPSRPQEPLPEPPGAFPGFAGVSLLPVRNPARKRPSGDFSTPREWWKAQEEFYGVPLPPYPGD